MKNSGRAGYDKAKHGKWRRIIWGVAVFVSGCLASGCGDENITESGDSAERLVVVTTIPPIYCMAVNVAGELAEVENLLPPSSDPHEYQFTPRDLRRLQEADVIFLNGLGLETWLEGPLKTVREASGAGKVVRVAADLEGLIPMASTESTDPDSGPDSGLDSGPAWNPHVWLDPVLAGQMVAVIAETLAGLEPEDAAIFQSRATAYREKLESLDTECRRLLEPVRGVPFATYHDAFPYWVRRYGLNHVGVLKPSSTAPPSAHFLVDLMEKLRRREVRVIFVDGLPAPRLARRLAEDLDIPLAVLATGENAALESGAYEDLVRRNGETMRRHLSIP